MNVEFAAPVGYRDHHEEHETSNDSGESDVTPVAIAKPLFPGSGHRLDGKSLGDLSCEMLTTTTPLVRGIPDYEYRIGIIRFIRMVPRASEVKQSNSNSDDFQAFKGTGQTLHSRKK